MAEGLRGGQAGRRGGGEIFKNRSEGGKMASKTLQKILIIFCAFGAKSENYPMFPLY